MFEPSGSNESPEAMVCAACRCHRNYHRKVTVDLPPQPHEMTRSPPRPQPAPEAGPSVLKSFANYSLQISDYCNYKLYQVKS
ncbi:zinc-finger homeodomain protein 2 [Phtheirospermum japonicum]|uniref:Zinc-finger homeodomain protein 2 n=1 Tax=Phtheirospermum japonicum TaxID=374723 RepID=A0A830D1U1_9LAMI|nr:zinc-finger homeodomain protein 2 [Phtheirospermum japonicum]